MLSTPTYFLAIFLLGMISSGLSQRAIDFRQLPTPRKISNQPCTAPGIMCKDCSTIQACVNYGSNSAPEFIATPVQTCNSNSSCLNGLCVAKTDPNPFCQSAYDNFECPSYGMFPDPAYCKIFHMCVPEEGTSGEVTVKLNSWKCEDGYGYNARTKVCDKKLINNQCPLAYPVPVCKKPGQETALPENPSIYTICGYRGEGVEEVLYPTMKTCPNGKVYRAWGCQ